MQSPCQRRAAGDGDCGDRREHGAEELVSSACQFDQDADDGERFVCVDGLDALVSEKERNDSGRHKICGFVWSGLWDP